MTVYRCADAAEAAGDAMVATAPPAERWLLVEHPGPWGRYALTDSGIAPEAVAGLATWADLHRARVVLIRRPGAAPHARTGGRWCHVDSRPGQENLRWGSYTEETELLDVLTDPSAGEPSAEPVYLVCAHGRHDVCCAIRGRPVAAALAAAYPDRTWECSHIGGDRFAANVVLLPHGFYLGHVPSARAAALAARYDDGEVDVAHLRGRSALPPPQQAAQHHARLALGEAGVDALPVLATENRGDGCWRVLLGGSRPLAVTVRAGVVDAGRRLTCAARGPGRYRVFELVDLA
ncbi:MAG TPA: sucrase ferredoxin [Pseudonocardiaceae bacterium]